MDTPSRAVPINRGQSKVVQALAGVTMVTGYKRRRRLLLSRVTLRGSGPPVGASVCRLSDAASDPPPSPGAGGAGWPRGADPASSARGAGIQAERQRGCRRDAG